MLPRAQKLSDIFRPWHSVALCLNGFLVLIALLTLNGCSQSNPNAKTNPGPTRVSAPTSPTDSYKNFSRLAPANPSLIRTGDNLTISLQGIPDSVVVPAQVDDTGAINLRFIGSLRAAGLTPSGLARAIRKAYLEGRYYNSIDVSVALAERYIYVGGEVNRPGRVIWTPDLTLSGAIAAAGGTTPYARQNSVLLNRDNDTHTLDARPGSPDNDGNTPLVPGDRLTLMRSSF
jgi:polysaccharide biosynthesis/export protein VpsN